jgi:signal peptidase I
MKSLIGNLIFASVLLLIATRFLSVFTGTFFPIDIVTSDSMNPSLMEGDLVAWTPTPIEEVKTGDVVVFKSWINWPRPVDPAFKDNDISCFHFFDRCWCPCDEVSFHE